MLSGDGRIADKALSYRGQGLIYAELTQGQRFNAIFLIKLNALEISMIEDGEVSFFLRVSSSSWLRH